MLELIIMIHIFKHYLKFEQKFGSAESVKEKARAYVEVRTGEIPPLTTLPP